MDALSLAAIRMRDVHRFGFDSFAKMAAEGEKYLTKTVEMIEAHPDVSKA